MRPNIGPMLEVGGRTWQIAPAIGSFGGWAAPLKADYRPLQPFMRPITKGRLLRMLTPTKIDFLFLGHFHLHWPKRRPLMASITKGLIGAPPAATPPVGARLERHSVGRFLRNLWCLHVGKDTMQACCVYLLWCEEEAYGFCYLCWRGWGLGCGLRSGRRPACQAKATRYAYGQLAQRGGTRP